MTIEPYPRSSIPVSEQSNDEVLTGMPSEEGGADYYWSARAGQDLASVLKSWSGRAGVQFVWDMPDYRFPVLRSLTLSGDYETAVRVILDQYKIQDPRPVGRLYLPSVEHGSVLVLSLEK